MSFGFSVGDFIAVGKLIKDISSCLQDAGGAKADYQELLRELESLQNALQHLDKLQNENTSLSHDLDSIKYAALSCRRPLEAFLGNMRKYESTLGVWSKSTVMNNTAKKLGWGLGRKEEVRKLQAYLNIHIGTINILLAEHGLAKMELASDKATADHLQVKDILESTRGIVERISSSLKVQNMVVEKVQAMLERMFGMISGDLIASYRSLGDMVAKVCVSTQQSYGILVEIKSSLTRPDTRWTYFQDPLMVEDALGFRFPVPSEYDFGLLEAVIKQRFVSGPGSTEVKAGNYEYLNTRNSGRVIQQDSRLLPGTSIIMAILVVPPKLTDAVCPMPNCRSSETTACSGGGRNW
ncbi:hypothetical protein DM02DRAFT_680954 [Periconia macrospinosa]|uniref:Ubiquitin-like domain-containing protein n=1 Tax=Periconia macrospinosa TaxID=97972 RepID=A0A2V1DKV5_9PLEO|nr:hypothetical protein DM02DRAFT_680954 [Periconia macrospinosa]